jgi:hypothetical protein
MARLLKNMVPSAAVVTLSGKSVEPGMITSAARAAMPAQKSPMTQVLRAARRETLWGFWLSCRIVSPFSCFEWNVIAM